jgi:hypothetical protein
MYFSSMILLVITFVSVFYSGLSHPNNERISDTFNTGAVSATSIGYEDSTEADTRHPRHGAVGNPNVVRAYDCALRAFTIEMATYIKPNSSRTNWTALSESALQMQECNMSYGAYEPPVTAKPFATAAEMYWHTFWIDQVLYS